MADRVSVSSRSELAAALRSCRGALFGVGLFSGISNVLMLTGAMFMLEIYDRVLPSRSIPTLAGLAILAATLFAFLGVIDLIRSRVMVRIGLALDEALGARVYDATVRLPLKAASASDGLQPIRDFDSIRSFLSGPGPIALFDLPWLPLYLGICFAFHVLIGTAALLGALILIALTLLTEVLTRGPMRAATGFAVSRNGLTETGRRNIEALTALGMTERMQAAWGETNRDFQASQLHTSDIAGGLGAVVKVLRMAFQALVLGVGAYLVIQQEATAGIIIAGSILAGRALAPVDLAIANWRGFVAARQSWARLSKLLAQMPAAEERMPLPPPAKSLSVEAASATPPGSRNIVVQDVTFALKSGDGLGVIGPSASGKSSLARLLVGVWPPVRGKVRLDSAALDQWSGSALGRHVGYLPQDVELIAGTVAQNIARFEPEADPTAIVAAAQAAGVHEMIVGLGDGYDTNIGEQGQALSAGQRQRVALARALYGDPFLVVLDEPNSNLDHEGDEALTKAILGIRARGGIVVVVAHRASALAGVDQLLAMARGRIQAFGPKDEVLRKILRRPPAVPVPFSLVPDIARPR